MANNSYYLYQLYESRDGSEFYPSYPAVYSNVGDGTYPKVLKQENDPACGGGEYEPIYRWTVSTNPNDYICERYNKYAVEYKQVSYDNGVTWRFVIPSEKRKTDIVLEKYSYDCGYMGQLERWVTVPNEYVCDDCNTDGWHDDGEYIYKGVAYKLEYLGDRISYRITPKNDEGNFFKDYPSFYSDRANYKLTMYFSNGEKLTYDYSDGTVITRDLVLRNKTEDYIKYNLKAIVIGDRVTEIDDNAFHNTSSLQGYLLIPRSCKRIGYGAFWGAGQYYAGISLEFEEMSSLEIIRGNALSNVKFKYRIIFPSSLPTLSIPDDRDDYSLNENGFHNFAINDVYLDFSLTNIRKLKLETNRWIIYPPFIEELLLSSITYFRSINLPNTLKILSIDCTNHFISKLVIPDSVEKVYSLVVLDELRSAIIGESVKLVSAETFLSYSPNLENITFRSKKPPLILFTGAIYNVYENYKDDLTYLERFYEVPSSFLMCTNNCPIYVPDESVDLYKTEWYFLSDRIKPISSKK